ncbi:MAG: 1-acyl-sn-glycerol-3-phosphate acyltransferase [Lachnospiraceae bacterium]|nr:1-acyl-sn-glycerol-3-phosphate acyltransferase [Lachnospiraceae bacterium]
MIFLKILCVLIGIILCYILFLIVSSLFINPNMEYEINSRFYRFLLNSATAIAFVATRLKVHTIGMEHLPKEGRFLLVCNHRSKFDPIITWYILRKYDLAFISKAENFNVPIFGRFIRKCCFMAIDRENPKKAMETIQRAAKLIERDEVSIGVYPEGTRSKTTELLPFHNGVFKIAQKAKVPIVIVAIQGTEQIKSNYPLHRSHIQLSILETLPTDYVTSHKTAEIGEYVRLKMNEVLQQEEEPI